MQDCPILCTPYKGNVFIEERSIAIHGLFEFGGYTVHGSLVGTIPTLFRSVARGRSIEFSSELVDFFTHLIDSLV